MKRERFIEELKTVLEALHCPDSPTDVNLSPYQLTLGMYPLVLEGKRELFTEDPQESPVTLILPGE